MADTITSATTLDVEFAFVDGDTRLQKIKDPRDDISASDIESLNQMIRANNLIIGDRYKSTFAQINYAKKVTKTTTTFDVNP